MTLYALQMSRKTKATTLAVLATLLHVGAGVAAPVTVEILPPESAEGAIHICVWYEKDGFPFCTAALAQATLDAGGNPNLSAVLDIDPTRDFAVTAFQDLDEDGKIKRNFIGMPKEPVAIAGLSQRPRGRPSFGKLSIPAGSNDALTLTMLD